MLLNHGEDLSIPTINVLSDKEFSSILPLIKPNDEGLPLNFQDAYLQVPIHPSSWLGGHVPEGPRAPPLSVT